MFYVVLIWVCYIFLSFCDKASGNGVNGIKHAVKYAALRSFFGALCALVLLLFSGSGFSLTLPTLLSAIAFGVLVAADLLNFLFLAKTGMVALMTVSGQAGSLLIPLFAGVFIFSNPVKPIQWPFIVLLIFASYLLCNSSKGIYKNFSYNTVLMTLARLLFCGLGTVSMQIFEKYGNENLNLFFLLAFIVSGTVLSLTYPFLKAEGDKSSLKLSKKLILFAFIAAAVTFGVDAFVVLAMKYLPPVIQFPLTAAGSITVSWLIGAICFKEKITIKSTAAIILSATSVIMINYFN